MPSKRGKKEEVFIRRFVSAYENFAWADSELAWLDTEMDGAIEALVTRADNQTMAIEHTLIEPFVGDKRDYAMFAKEFLRIEGDMSLLVPDTGITIYIPVGILNGKKQVRRNTIVGSIHLWIKNNRLRLREGEHLYQCDVPGMPSVPLTVKRNKFGHSRPNSGSLLIRRQQVVNDLDKVVEKALRTKLPKLINTKADRRLLFLERDQFTFHPELIFAEIARQRPNFPELERVDEIWHVETVFYAQDGYVNFELWKLDQLLATITFQGDALIGHSKNDIPYPM